MFRGERFEIDLGEDNEGGNNPAQSTVLPGAFVNDVLERKPAAAKPPTAPTLKSKTGFPEHGPRKTESRFKQRMSAKPATTATTTFSKNEGLATQDGLAEQLPPSGKARTWEEEEKARIDRENNDRLAGMSSAEIEQERRELMSSLSPEMIQKLLQRSTIESGSAEEDLSKHREPVPGSIIKRSRDLDEQVDKKVTFVDPSQETDDQAGHDAEAGTQDPSEAESADSLPKDDSIHFPRPAQPPDLDPSSNTFLADLHQKYFPSLPSDPEKLEWMQSNPSSTSSKTKTNSYDPSAPGIEPKDIRFSFKGALIPPSTAAQIPVTAGLHHHGDAPDAAGYTISELSHLSRSSFPAQRCIAFQTLGRILFRLGKGEFGDASESADVVGAETMGALARGLWREMGRERVTEMLVAESEGRGVDGGRHVSAKAYATEAVWLWQRGGGKMVGTE